MRWQLGLFLGTLSFPAHSTPEIYIGAFVEYLDGGKSTLLKQVRNIGSTTAFVKVQVQEIVYGDDDELLERAVAPVLHDPSGKDKDGQDVQQSPTLVASPARLMIPANAAQTIRLLHLGSRGKEHYYRLRFIPVLPEQNDDFGVTATQAEAYRQSLSADVTILTAYGTVIVVRPRQTTYKTQMQDEKNRFIVRNEGNSVIVLDDFKACSAADQCGPGTRWHVRPRKSRVFEKEPGHDYRFDLVEGDSRKAVTFGK